MILGELKVNLFDQKWNMTRSLNRKDKKLVQSVKSKQYVVYVKKLVMKKLVIVTSELV